MESIIELHDVTYSYPGTFSPVLKDIAFTIMPSEFLSIIGPSACGKSTLALVLSGVIPTKLKGAFSGYVNINGKVRTLFQNPDNQLFSLTVYDDIAFGLRCQRLSENQVRECVQDIAIRLGIDDLLVRTADSLSTGQKQKVALASILCLQPDVLILDEPTANIDPGYKNEVCRLFKELNHSGTTVILIEHNIHLVQEYSSRIIHIEKGQLIADERNNNASKRVPNLHLPARHDEELALLTKDCPQKGKEKLIKVQNVSFTYPNGLQALDNVNLTIFSHEFLVILGHNGSGKTTLAKHLNGLLQPTTGKITVRHGEPSPAIVGYTFQNPSFQFFEPTVYQELEFGPKNLGLENLEIQRRVEETLASLHIAHLKDRDPHSLSVGEKRKVSIASVLAMKPHVIVLDEPTTGLDCEAALELMRMISQLCETGHSIIVLTHEVTIATKYCDRVLELSDGKILWDSSNSEFQQRLDTIVYADTSQQEQPHHVPSFSRYSLPEKRMHPSIRMIALCLTMFVAFIVDNISIIILFTLIFTVFWVRYKHKLREFTTLSLLNKSYRFLCIFPILLFFLYWFVERNMLTALINSISFVCRLGVLGISALIFSMTMSQHEILQLFQKLRMPYELAFMLSLALRAVPLLIKDLQNILDVQRSRAFKLKLKNFHAVVIPTIITLLTRSLDITLSMQTKGFRSERK